MVKSMDQFLQYESELAPGSGFELWSLPHILWLLVLGLIAAMALLGARRCGGRGERWIRSTFAICALLMQVLPALLIMWKGMYSKYTLPLHICSLASYAVFAHMLFAEKSVILSELLFFPFLPGAMCALLFPDWTVYPPCSFFSSAGFLVHGAIIIYILLCIDERIIVPSARRWSIPIAFMVLYAGIMLPFDRVFGVNYGFLNTASPGSPLVWLADTFGAGIGYYASYGAAVIVVMGMWYGVWVARHRL